jgi:hypothetical protein
MSIESDPIDLRRRLNFELRPRPRPSLAIGKVIRYSITIRPTGRLRVLANAKARLTVRSVAERGSNAVSYWVIGVMGDGTDASFNYYISQLI